MAQLSIAVTATSRRWRVDAMPAARLLRVEDELVEVLSRSPQDSTIRVRRGIEGSTAASHDAGTVLEAPVFGGDGGEQIIRLLGPFRVDFDDEGLSNADVIATEVPAGALIINAWITVATAWAAGSAVTLNLFLVEGEWDGDRKIYEVNLSTAVLASDEAGIGMSPEPISVVGVYYTASSNCTLHVEVDGTGITAGAVDVYALIAEPA